MSARTALLHRPAELTLLGCDDHTNIAVFQADSAHDAARVNTVAIDLLTGTILCDCRGAECGKQCWHADHVLAAWRRTPAAIVARHLSDTALCNLGKRSAALAATYRARIGRPLQDDVTALVAARWEWRRRAARPAARSEALALAA